MYIYSLHHLLPPSEALHIPQPIPFYPKLQLSSLIARYDEQILNSQHTTNFFVTQIRALATSSCCLLGQTQSGAAGTGSNCALVRGVAVFFSVFVSFRLLKVTVIGNDGSFSNNLKWLRPGARFPVIGIWYGCMRRLVTWRNWLHVRLRTHWSGG